MESAETIRRRRLEVWNWYYEAFASLENRGCVRRPIVPPDCEHNAHMFYLLTADAPTRTRLLRDLNERGVNAVFHYVPLHSSPAGARLARAHGRLETTESVSTRLVRLPIWIGLERSHVDRVVSSVESALA
jgi:dTDP-4-amino-4,6-dideoxygalactose transaminase